MDHISVSDIYGSQQDLTPGRMRVLPSMNTRLQMNPAQSCSGWAQVFISAACSSQQDLITCSRFQTSGFRVRTTGPHHLPQEGVAMQIPVVQMQYRGVHVRCEAVVPLAGEEHDVGQLHIQDLHQELSRMMMILPVALVVADHRD